MELHDDGLIDQWIKREPHEYKNIDICLNEPRQRQQCKVSDNNTQTSLENFAVAFYILIAGYFISLVFFVRENFYFRLFRYRMTLPKHSAKQNRNISQNTTD